MATSSGGKAGADKNILPSLRNQQVEETVGSGVPLPLPDRCRYLNKHQLMDNNILPEREDGFIEGTGSRSRELGKDKQSRPQNALEHATAVNNCGERELNINGLYFACSEDDPHSQLIVTSKRSSQHGGAQKGSLSGQKLPINKEAVASVSVKEEEEGVSTSNNVIGNGKLSPVYSDCNAITTNNTTITKTSSANRVPGSTFNLTKAELQDCWTRYREFEELSLPGRRLSLLEFIAEWEARMRRAVRAGCQYSDTILAFSILHKARLSEAEVQLVLTALDLTLPRDNNTLLSQVISSLYQFCSVQTKHECDGSTGLGEEVKEGERQEVNEDEEVMDDRQDELEMSGVKMEEVETSPAINNQRANHPCDLCEKTFSTRYHLNQHILIHTVGKRFGCERCGKRFGRKTHLQTHERTHADIKPFACDRCPKSYATNAELRRHTNQHLGIKPFKCDICQEAFVAGSDLHGHKRTYHEGKTHQCELCPKAFKSKVELEMHSMTHSGEKRFACDVCSKLFLSKSNLKKHYRIHTGERPYQCELCPKAFRCNTNLQNHINMHNDVRNFQCDICLKAYFDKGTLDKHRRSHTEEPQFQCSICSHKFRKASNLKHHEMTHNGEKPFQCEFCTKGFTAKNSLERHLLTHVS